MKTNNEIQENQQLEILKAVAQAWLCHSGSSRKSTNEYDAYRRNFPFKASRFKLETLKTNNVSTRYWDFNQSLLDSYEIVTLSKRLERGLVLDDESRVHRRRRESSNSLRSLFNRLASRRFNQGWNLMLII
ncbi:uncharacterized protein [Euphorbia lathyris]|uniref:uncharacterized protein isoform X1 n=1 Tax=Euphorbia lathyris TaxID=212925 RepID=UPI0033131327